MWLKRFISYSIILLLLGGLVFLVLINSYKGASSVDSIKTDAIIVLTGDQHRVGTGIEIFENNPNSKILITGVYQGNNDKAIFNQDKERHSLITLDYTATDTAGNAKAAQDWMERNKFSEAVIVTSHYHMPRTQINFFRLMPTKKFDLVAVKSDSFQSSDWWKKKENWQTLVRSYLKFIATLPFLVIPE